MKKTIKYISFFVLACVSAGCSDEKFDVSKMDTATFILNTDWSEGGENVELPGRLTVVLGDDTFYVNRTESIFTSVPVGPNRVVAFNEPYGLFASGTVLSTGIVDGELYATPDWLFSCRNDVDIRPLSENVCYGVMRQDIRQLNFLVKTPPADISVVEAVVSGVAAKIDLAFNRHFEEGEIKTTLESLDDTEFAGFVRMLGTAGNSLTVTFEITYADQSRQSVATTIERIYVNFNRDKHIPVTVSVDLSDPAAGTTLTGGDGEWTITIGNTIVNRQ